MGLLSLSFGVSGSVIYAGEISLIAIQWTEMSSNTPIIHSIDSFLVDNRQRLDFDFPIAIPEFLC